MESELYTHRELYCTEHLNPVMAGIAMMWQESCGDIILKEKHSYELARDTCCSYPHFLNYILDRIQ